MDAGSFQFAAFQGCSAVGKFSGCYFAAGNGCTCSIGEGLAFYCTFCSDITFDGHGRNVSIAEGLCIFVIGLLLEYTFFIELQSAVDGFCMGVQFLLLSSIDGIDSREAIV